MAGMKRLLVGVISVALLLALAGPALAAKPPAYRTPGFKGIKKAPRTKPAKPPRAIQLSGAGVRPNVLVDDAGTAHVVWNEEGGDNPDAMRYCRIKRSSRVCDNPDATRAFVPQQPTTPGNSPAFNEDNEGPRVVALGDQLVLITRRYPNGVTKPNGGDVDTSIYIWVSDDGGESFTGPGLVGDGYISGGAFAFNAGGADRIGVISDTATGGTYFQALRPGAFVAGYANLGAGDVNRAYYASLAADGTTIATAFADLSNQIFVRRWTGLGDPGSAANWSQDPPIAGSEPRLAGGPAGLFMMSRVRPTGGYSVRRLTPGSAGRAVPVSTTSDAVARDFFQDSGGQLHAAWINRSAATGNELLKRVSADGRTFRTASLVARGDIGAPDIGGAFDGGGLAVFESGEGIAAAAFGTQGRTGRLGLGAKSGGGLPPGTVSSCQKVSFGAVDMSTEEGCLLAAAKGGPQKVSEGTLKFNGLEIVPDAGVKLIIDPRKRILSATGRVRVLLRAPGFGEIVLWHGDLDLKMDDPGAGSLLASFDMSKFNGALKGFPLEGKVDVYLTKNGVRIPVFLRLPPIFAGITGEAVLVADTERGLQLDSVKVDIEDAMIGPLELKKLRLEYTASSDRWDGDFLLGLPPRPVAGDLGAGATFEGGDFIRGTVNVPLPPPGVALYPGVFLTQVGGELKLKPLEIAGTLTVTAVGAIRVDGEVRAKFPTDAPSEFSLKARVAIYDWGFANASVLFKTDGYFEIKADVDFDLEVVSIKGGAYIFVDGPREAFGSEIAAEVCLRLGAEICASGRSVLSSKGIGACGEAFGGAAYITYAWGGDFPDDVDVDVGDSCQLESVTVQPRVAQAGATTFTVARGSRAESLSIQGQGGAPSVVLVSPSGERITPAAVRSAGVRAWGGAIPQLSQTVVAIDRPAAGTWRIETQPGSPLIAGVEQKTDRGPVEMSARVSKAKGGKRRLTYRVERRPGVRVLFSERGAGGGGEIGYARGTRGTLTFDPAPGRAGTRRIVAMVERDGLPGEARTLTRYRAPGPARPARVRGLVVKRSKGGLTVRWRAASKAKRYVVRVRSSRGLSRSQLVRKRVLRVPGVRRGDRVTVSVRGLSDLGLQGPAATKRVRR